MIFYATVMMMFDVDDGDDNVAVEDDNHVVIDDIYGIYNDNKLKWWENDNGGIEYSSVTSQTFPDFFTTAKKYSRKYDYGENLM